jgi:hypothetical protein
VSHVAIGGLELNGVPVVLHASVGGVQVTPRSSFLYSHTLVSEYAFQNVEVDVPGAIVALGERYDYVGLFGYVVVAVGRWFGKKLKNPFASPHATVCSEFVFALDRDKSRLPEWSSLVPSSTEPQDLVEIARLHSEHFERVFPEPAPPRLA